MDTMVDLTRDDEVASLAPERDSLVARAQGLVIRNTEGYEEAGGWLRLVKGALKKIEDARNRVKKPLVEAGRAIDAQAKEAAAPWLDAETKIKTAILSYQREQDRIRQEEQRKANERAEAERRRLLEQQREAEAKARAEAEAKRKAAEEAAAAGRAAEAARLAAQAERIEDKAAERAETLQDRAASIVAPVIDRSPPKVEGIKTRKVWKFRVTDPKRINAAFLVPDEKKIGAQVRALGADAGPIIGDGVEIWSEEQIAAGAA